MSEEFYDREIAPKLLKMAKKCKKRGLSLVAHVEYERGETGTTQTVRENADPSIRLTSYAAQSFGNADKLIMALLKDGRENGHNSIYLRMLENKEAQA